MADLDSVALIVREFGETEIAKSAGICVTLSVTIAQFMTGGSDGSVPVTFKG